MKSKLFLLVGLATTALLLAACQVNVATKVASNGAGELRTEIGFTPSEKQSITQLSGKDTSNLCADTLASPHIGPIPTKGIPAPAAASRSVGWSPT